MSKRKPKVGDILYVVECGNLARNGKEPRVQWGDVCKVGRLYFYVDTGWPDPTSFHIDTWKQKTDYSVDYILYESDKAYGESKEVDIWIRAFNDAFRFKGPDVSLQSYSAAAKLLGISIPDKG